MRAVLVAKGGALTWSDVAEPKPRPGEVVIDIEAAGVNRADLMQRAGSYPPPAGWPEWMGLEVSGHISYAPEGSRWRVGDAVCALLGGGGYAQRVAVPEALVLPVPSGLSMVEAAALPEALATVYLNLRLEAGLAAGDIVFIQAGASGLGVAAIGLVKALGGRVVTTVGSQAKAEFVRALGADTVVVRGTDDLAAALDSLPPDIALDCVGGAELALGLAKMAPGGRWVVIATLGGALAEIDMNSFFRRGLRLIGSTLRSRSPEAKARLMAALEQEVWPLLANGTLRPVIHQALPMTEADAAQGILRERANLGKVVLTRA